MYEEFGPPQLPLRRVPARRHKAIFTAIAGYITTTLVAAGLSTFIAGAVANIAIGAALTGIGQLASAVFGGGAPQTSTPQAQATLNQSAGQRIRGYGRAKLGGIRAFFDSRNARLYQLIMAHHGQIDAFEQFYVGDLAITRDFSGSVTSWPFNTYMRIVEHDGNPDQGADGEMLFAWPDVWTSAHRLRGIAYWFVDMASPPAADFQGVFPEGYNTPITCICRLSQVYDPRNDTTAWSDNASLCILDYILSPDGYRLSIDEVDLESFAAFADICDEDVPLAGGGTEKRYRIWGIYGLTDEPQSVMGKMRAACDAEIYQTSAGKIGIRGGTWEPPTVTIHEGDILGHSMEQGNSRFSAFNSLKILFTSPDHDFQTTEATPWEDLEDQDERGVLESSLNLDMVPSPTQARRLAKIHIAKANPTWKGTVSANLSALDALGERTVRLVIPELDIDDAFFVAGFAIRPDLTGVDISVMSISEASYTWSTTEESTSPPAAQDTRPDLDFPVPQSLVLTKSSGIVTATVASPGRGDLALKVQIRAGAGSLWQDMATLTQTTASFNPGTVSSSTTFQARAQWQGALGAVGQWSSPLASIVLP